MRIATFPSELERLRGSVACGSEPKNNMDTKAYEETKEDR
jgi:hypothetical protein